MANPKKATNSKQNTKGNKEVMEEDQLNTRETLPYAVYRKGLWLYGNIANDKQAQEEVKERLRRQITGLQRRIHYIDALGRR